MRRGFLIFLLSIGTVGGFASGFHHVRQHRGHYGGWDRHHDCGGQAASSPSAKDY